MLKALRELVLGPSDDERAEGKRPPPRYLKRVKKSDEEEIEVDLGPILLLDVRVHEVLLRDGVTRVAAVRRECALRAALRALPPLQRDRSRASLAGYRLLEGDHDGTAAAMAAVLLPSSSGDGVGAAGAAAAGAAADSTGDGVTGWRSAEEDRAVGAVLGMAVGDATGAPLEFMRVSYGKVHTKRGLTDWLAEDDELGYVRGGFGLRAGQWTDDTSMGLCLADSLLVYPDWNPADAKNRFVAWWEFGYNNAFGTEDPPQGSVGLGGNISGSLTEYERGGAVFCQSGGRDTSGNGGLMRLAPVAIAFHDDEERAAEVAKESSLLTHRGVEARDLAALWAVLICRAIHWDQSEEEIAETRRPRSSGAVHDDGDDDKGKTAAAEAAEADPSDKKRAAVTTKSRKQKKRGKGKTNRAEPLTARALLADIDFPELEVVPSVRALMRSEAETPETQPDRDDLKMEDRDWNWRASEYRYAPTRARLQPGYVGSYAMDAAAMALHCVWSTTSFEECALKAANLRGDADTVCAIACQIAGAIYGASAIPEDWVGAVMQWDHNGDIAARAVKLFRHESVVPSGLKRALKTIRKSEEDRLAREAAERKEASATAAAAAAAAPAAASAGAPAGADKQAKKSKSKSTSTSKQQQKKKQEKTVSAARQESASSGEEAVEAEEEPGAAAEAEEEAEAATDDKDGSDSASQDPSSSSD